MSRIIKSSVWSEEPHVVEVPQPPPPKEEKDEAKELGEGGERSEEVPEEEDTGPSEAEIEMLRDLQRRRERDEAELEAKREAMMADCLSKKKEADEIRKDAEKYLAQTKADCAVMRADAEQETKAIIDDAHEQAQHIRDDAEKAGHEKGVAEGREEGVRQIREEQKQIILDANAKAEKTLADAKEECRVYVVNAENEIAALAMDIVEHILPQHFIDVPQIVLPLIRKALLKVKEQSEVHVRVAPANFDLVLMARSEFQGLLEGQALLEVHSDEDLKEGDVVIETPNGNVDARLSTQLEIIRKAIQDVMQ